MYHDRHEGGRGGGGAGGGVDASDGTQPAMMSFKTFLATQDDTISDEEAIKKYAEYKLEFKRQQLNEFFVSHKDEEWYVWQYSFCLFNDVGSKISQIYAEPNLGTINKYTINNPCKSQQTISKYLTQYHILYYSTPKSYIKL